MQRHFLVRSCCALIGLSSIVVAHAASDVWDGNGLNPPSGVWGVGANWLDNTTPGNGDTATFSVSPFAHTVIFTSAPAAIQGLNVVLGAINFTSSGGAQTLNVTSASGGQDVTITSGQLTLGTAGNPLHLTAGDDLSLQPGALLNAKFGSDIIANDFSSSGLNGVLAIDGLGSNLTINADSNIGGIPGTGTLVLTNDGEANFAGSLGVANSATANANGTLSIQSGAQLDLAGDLLLATGNVAGQVGTVTLTGGTSQLLRLAGSSSITVGSATNGTAAINLGSSSDNGSLVIGTGTLTINATGAVTMGIFGYLISSGDVIVNGGSLQVADADNFDLGASDELTIQNGGTASFTGDYDIAQEHLYRKATVTGSGSTWTISGALKVGDSGDQVYGARLLIAAGGIVSSNRGNIGTDPGSSSAASSGTVTGAGSTWTMNSSLYVGSSDSGTLLIEAGGLVSSYDTYVGKFTGGSGTITINGPGSTLNSDYLDIGGNTNGKGTVIVENGGIANIDQDLVLRGQQATVILTGGRINLAELDFDNLGTFNFNYGTLNFTTSQTNSLGGPIEQALGGERRLRFGQHLGIEGTLTLDAPFQMDGGYLEVASLVANGNLQFTSGTLGFTGAGGIIIGSGGPLGTAVTLAAGQTINVTNTTAVNSGAVLVVNSGGNFSSATISNSGEIVLDGSLATLRSTTIFNNAGLLHGRGRVDAFLNNQSTGEVRAAAGDVLQFIGISPNLNNGRINLLGGTIEFTQSGLINNNSGQIVGHGSLAAKSLFNDGTIAFSGQANVLGPVTNDDGTIISSGGGPTTFFDDVVNDGVIRTSLGSVSVFFGSVSGTGTFTGPGTVNFEGDLSPGSSPGLVSFGGDVLFGGLNTFTVELGGTTPGSQHDRIVVSGALSLDGTLAVKLIDSYMPLAGHTFDILEFASLTGTFSVLDLPALAMGLSWNSSQLYTTGTLSVVAVVAGDYNNDGKVGGADYVLWRKNPASFGGIPAGYNTWRANFGSPPGSGSSISGAPAVPEPACTTLILLGVGVVGRKRRRFSCISPNL